MSRKILLYAFIILDVSVLLLIGFLFLKNEKSENEAKRAAIESTRTERAIEIDWRPENQIYPLTYMAEEGRMVELKIDSPRYANLQAEILVQGITNKKKTDLNVRPGAKVYYLNPKITSEGYKKLDVPKSFIVNIKIIDPENNNKLLLEDEDEIQFMSYNDIVWEDKGKDFGKYVIRLVDKDKPEIEELVGKAASHIKSLGGETNSMLGPLGDKGQQKKELKAIFKAITDDYEVNYVLAPFSYESAETQQIKTPTEVLKTKSGLCIELSLLVAAALENIGLRPVIVLTTGHAWVGIETSPKTEDYIFIETTMLDKNPEEAVEFANNNFERVKKIGDYKILNVSDLRLEGLNPINY